MDSIQRIKFKMNENQQCAHVEWSQFSSGKGVGFIFSTHQCGITTQPYLHMNQYLGTVS